MGHNPKTADIFEAWFEWEHCEPSKRKEQEAGLNRLLDAIAAESKGECTRDQILDHLFSAYKDYKTERRRNAQIQIARMKVKRS